MMPGSKGQNVVLACKIRHLNLGPAKHEEVAIYAVNMRIPNVLKFRKLLWSNSQASFNVERRIKNKKNESVKICEL